MPFQGRLPVLDIDIGGGVQVLPQVLPFILGYGTIRLLIEWAQSSPGRRQRTASRVDLAITLVLGAAACVVLGRHHLPTVQFSARIAIPAGSLIVLGTAIGAYAGAVISDLPMIRSHKTAKRLALPRAPAAVRALWRSGILIGPPAALAALLSPSFSAPLSQLWPWLIGVPAVIAMFAGVIDLALPRRTLPDGTVISRREYFNRLRVAYDVHDTHYQIGGWDTRVPPANSPLYEAAQRGDLAGVRQLLDADNDPNESNMHGWTALMIAVANQHPAVVELLLARGADPNRSNLLGRTPLMFACRYGHLQMAETLLDHGSTVDAVGAADAETALFGASRSGNVALTERLLAAGADPLFRDPAGLYPDQHAEKVGAGDVARVLRRARLDRGGRGRPTP